MKRLLSLLFVIGTSIGLTGCGYNAIQSLDEQSKAAWSEVVSQYFADFAGVAACAAETHNIAAATT